METIVLTEKDFKDGVYCGKDDLSNIDGNLEINVSGWLRFEGDIYAEGGISAEGDISAEGGIYAKGGIYAEGDISAGGGISAEGGIYAKGDIYAKGGISAGGDISAKGGILEALHGITAGLKIYARTTIECGMRIFAGTTPWSWVGKEHREIKCGKLLKGEIAYGDLIETGLEDNIEVEKAIKLLEEKGIIKDGRIVV